MRLPAERNIHGGGGSGEPPKNAGRERIYRGRIAAMEGTGHRRPTLNSRG